LPSGLVILRNISSKEWRLVMTKIPEKENGCVARQNSHSHETIYYNNLNKHSIVSSFIIQEPIFIISVGFGYNLIKRPADDPSFEIWLDTNSSKDFVHRFNSFSDTIKFLVQGGFCTDYQTAIYLLNIGGTR
ncbi:MAG: hypothetical protein KDC52_11800, partial [Ignavibacteriae bacterium]|nr:hypothetical protein [Ignavibacteriota bacterium]